MKFFAIAILAIVACAQDDADVVNQLDWNAQFDVYNKESTYKGAV